LLARGYAFSLQSARGAMLLASNRNNQMSQRVFYQAQRVLAPIPDQRGAVTDHYIIAVNTYDPEGNEYKDLRTRAKDAFNLLPGRTALDSINLTEIGEQDVPKEKLEQVLLRHDSVLYQVKSG